MENCESVKGEDYESRCARHKRPVVGNLQALPRAAQEDADTDVDTEKDYGAELTNPFLLALHRLEFRHSGGTREDIAASHGKIWLRKTAVTLYDALCTERCAANAEDEVLSSDGDRSLHGTNVLRT